MIKKIIKEEQERFDATAYQEKNNSKDNYDKESEEDFHNRIIQSVNKQSFNINLSGAELAGLNYAINRSDAEDLLSKNNKLNTPVGIGLMSGKNKLSNILDKAVSKAYIES